MKYSVENDNKDRSTYREKKVDENKELAREFLYQESRKSLNLHLIWLTMEYRDRTQLNIVDSMELYVLEQMWKIHMIEGSKKSITFDDKWFFLILLIH